MAHGSGAGRFSAILVLGRIRNLALCSRPRMKEPFAAVEITDADFNRIENIGDLIRHIEILDERRQH